ncbi:AGE family epimerase/isomerase [Phenylobacterium parvum]|uniref:Mannose-1-phosphate guanylyltransferase n=1 Tax=Phenylobacterium parvum TaxID=2201350 RepID=A0A2Z3HSW2_9CAUL|nr:AGE family epimerase/isomerase [Phenylobacterium parvum]AWM77905.1 mannose-1-phosphate guanylyltransferase [Phenylobacterium parvum]
MSLYPVIMCGGSGVRLWPVSRPERPKPFARLMGGARTAFQETALRAAPLGPLLVIAGADHGGLIREQLAELGLSAQVLLEPEPRDSAPAMAAAAIHLLRRDEEAVMVVLAADHNVPDAAAFRDTVVRAAPFSRAGRIVTLGVAPTFPATGYGYIRPGRGDTVRTVDAFIEKPDAARAAALIAEGCLWNSGNFIVPATTLAYELGRLAPEVLEAAEAAVETATGPEDGLRLGEVFRTAPKISIDYAVMEKTSRAMVAAADFAWSDVGAWDVVHALSERDADDNRLEGRVEAEGVSGSYIRADGGAEAVVVGLSGIAVVADAGRVLVAPLSDSQAVKRGVERLQARGPAGFSTLAEAAGWFGLWLRTAALPVWWSLGADRERGGFVEAIAQDGSPQPAPRRGRVQGRMIFSFAQAGMMGWSGPWREAARHALAGMKADFLRPDGLVRTLVGLDGRPLDDTPHVYDQAFALLGLASLRQAGESAGEALDLAHRLRDGLEALRHPAGGFRESGDQPFQANAHMHLLEASLAWEEVGEAGWGRLSDEIASLALGAFIDHRGVLSEFFDADWRRADGDDGRLVEPGHQFEWAWLLDRWGRARGRADGQLAARALHEAGRQGVDPRRACAVNALWQDLTVRDGWARLWPQTEFLKSALALGETEDALQAAAGLRRYLDTPVRGLWRDRQGPTGGFAPGDAPATSLYHIVGAIRQLEELSPALSA